MIILGNVVGAIGVALSVIIYQQNKGRKLLIYKLISDFVWALHYFLLGGVLGTVVALIGVVREFTFLNKDKKWAASKLWLVLFIVISVTAAILNWKNIFSILPAIASVISVFSFWVGNPKLSRILSFPISACMLIYDIPLKAVLGIVNEIFTCTSSIVGIIRTKIQEKSN